MKTKQLWTLLIVGFVLRIIIIFWSFNFPQHPDLLRYRDWGRIAYLYGINETHNLKYITYGDKPNNLPPGATFVITGTYSTSLLVSRAILKISHLQEGTNLFLNIYLVDLFLKLPAVFADLVITVFIYLLIKKYAKSKATLLGATLFLFNPVIIYNSAFWSQIDSVNNAIFLISLFFLLQKKIFLAILFYLISLYFKLSLLPLFPFYLFFLYLMKIDLIKVIKYLSISVLILSFFTYLFFPGIDTWMDFFVLNNFRQEANFITVNAFNFWYFILLPFFPAGNFPASTPLLALSGYLLFILSCIPLVRFFLKNKYKPDYLFFFFSLLSLLVFLFLPRMHERYLYPMFPLLAISCGLNKKLIILYFSFSFLHLLNLLFVWHPFLIGFYSVFISNVWFGWICSLGIIGSGLLLYKKFLEKFY